MTAIFAACLIGQLGLGVKYKTWGYMGAMVVGLILEVISYAARIMIHNKPFNGDYFLMYLVTCTIAPALFTAAVSFSTRYLSCISCSQTN